MNPGDIALYGCTIVSERAPGGQIDITRNVYSFSVYESIFTPGITADIKIVDFNNLIDIYQFLGDELLFLTFGTRDNFDLRVKYLFGIYSIEAVEQPTSTGSSSTYTIRCVSLESLNAKTNYVQHSFNKPITEIMSVLHKEYLKSGKPLIIEPTKGKQKIVIPNLDPYDAINMVRGRAVSQNPDRQSSAFVYFETRDQNDLSNQIFKFVTIEELFTQTPIKTLSLKPITNLIESWIDNIITYRFDTTLNTVDHIKFGSKTRIGKMDMRTLDYTYADYSDFIPFKSGGTTPYESQLFNDLYSASVRNPPSVIVPYDSTDRPDTGIAEILYAQQNYISVLLQNRLILTAYGDPKMKAGDIVELKIPSRREDTESIQYDERFSGRWLITNIRHEFEGRQKTPEYACYIEVIKGNMQ